MRRLPLHIQQTFQHTLHIPQLLDVFYSLVFTNKQCGDEIANNMQKRMLSSSDRNK